MSIRLADLSDYRNRFVQVEYDTTKEGSDDGSRTITGKLAGVGPTAIVIQGRYEVLMIPLSDLLEIDEVLRHTSRDALTIRKIARTTLESVRQHLLDRHGMQASSVRGMTDEQATEIHDALVHDDLGHVHGPTEKGRPGRKPKKRVADESDLIPAQRRNPDGDPAHDRD